MSVPSQGHYGFHSFFRLLTDFVCLYTYEFWLSLCKIVRSSVILLLSLFKNLPSSISRDKEFRFQMKRYICYYIIMMTYLLLAGAYVLLIVRRFIVHSFWRYILLRVRRTDGYWRQGWLISIVYCIINIF